MNHWTIRLQCNTDSATFIFDSAILHSIYLLIFSLFLSLSLSCSHIYFCNHSPYPSQSGVLVVSSPCRPSLVCTSLGTTSTVKRSSDRHTLCVCVCVYVCVCVRERERERERENLALSFRQSLFNLWFFAVVSLISWPWGKSPAPLHSSTQSLWHSASSVTSAFKHWSYLHKSTRPLVRLF